MRKIRILKILVDFVCIMAIFVCSVIVIIVFGLLFNSDFISPKFEINDILYSSISKLKRLLLLIFVLVNMSIIYCLFLFRKVMNSFLELKIFDVTVINNFQRIGKILIFLGVFNVLSMVVYNVFFLEGIRMSVDLLPSIRTVVMIFLGLFFIILSEAFKLAKSTKEENDLTI